MQQAMKKDFVNSSTDQSIRTYFFSDCFQGQDNISDFLFDENPRSPDFHVATKITDLKIRIKRQFNEEETNRIRKLTQLRQQQNICLQKCYELANSFNNKKISDLSPSMRVNRFSQVLSLNDPNVNMHLLFNSVGNSIVFWNTDGRPVILLTTSKTLNQEQQTLWQQLLKMGGEFDISQKMNEHIFTQPIEHWIQKANDKRI